MGVAAKDPPEALREAIERENEAPNADDLEAIISMHAPEMVFSNHTAGESAKLAASQTRGRGELLAEPSGRRVESDGVDLVPFEDGLIKCKDLYADSVSILRQLGLLG